MAGGPPPPALLLVIRGDCTTVTYPHALVDVDEPSLEATPSYEAAKRGLAEPDLCEMTVTELLADLARSLADLHELTDELIARIEPILDTSTPVRAPEMSATTGRCHVSSDLVTAANRVATVQALLRRTIERVAL